jgi:cytoskeletal protein CcmA (bactofilin family)
LKASAKAKYNSDYIVCDKERYIEWLKAWHEADYSLPNDGNQPTQEQENRINQINKIDHAGQTRFARFRFPIQLFGEKRLYSPLQFPFADDESYLLPNPFYSEKILPPYYWNTEHITEYGEFKSRLESIFTSTFAENIIQTLTIIKGFSWARSSFPARIVNTVLKNSLIARGLEITQSGAVDLQHCIIKDFDANKAKPKSFKSKNSRFYSSFKLRRVGSLDISDSNFEGIENFTTTPFEHNGKNTIESSSFDGNLTLHSGDGEKSIVINKCTIKNLQISASENSEILIENKTKINGNLTIDGTQLKTITIKDNAPIQGECTITNRTSTHETNSENICTLSIDKTDFAQDLIFSHSAFKNIAIKECLFNQNLVLKNAYALESIEISGCIIQGNFDYSRDPKQTNEHSTIPKFDFKKVHVHGVFTAEHRNFIGRTSFVETTFHNPPIMHGATLHTNTIFRRSNFELTTPKKDPDGYYQNAEAAFRDLRHKMEGHRSKHEEARFFGLELESRRQHSKTDFLERVFLSLYKDISDYGQKIGEAVKSLIIWNLFFLLIYQLISIVFFNKCIHSSKSIGWCPYSKNTNFLSTVIEFLKTLSQSAMFTLEQTFRPFQIWRSDYFSGNNSCDDNGHFIWIDCINYDTFQLIKLIATVQSFGTAVLFALLLIVIRRKFQLS